MKRRQRRQRKGFTLTEVLLVMAILVMIGGMAVVGILNAQRSATRRVAMAEINTIETACTNYRIDMNRFPAKIQDLYSPPQGASPGQWQGPYLTKGDGFDPWGNEYSYQADEANLQVQIASAGPDGIPGNEDDVSLANNQ